jgi:hypothetical protein
LGAPELDCDGDFTVAERSSAEPYRTGRHRSSYRQRSLPERRSQRVGRPVISATRS